MLRFLTTTLFLALTLVCPRPARADGPVDTAGAAVVLYSDLAWHRLYVHDGSGVRSVAVDALGTLPAAGRRVGFATAVPADIGAATLPEARPVTALPGGGLAWVVVEATVRSTQTDGDGRLLLRADVAGRALDVLVPAAPPPAAPATRVGARLRLRGVLEPAADAWSHARLWVASWREAQVLIPAGRWEDLRQLTTAQVRALAPTGSEAELRVVARAIGRRSAHSFRLEDEAGTLTAELDSPDLVREGTMIEVRGFASTRRGEPALVDGRWRMVGTPPSRISRREPGLPALKRVADLRSLPRAEAERGYPVRLEAIVTYVSPIRRQLFVEDASGGVFVHASGDPGVSPGDRLLIEGSSAPGGLAPLVVAGSVRRLGTGALPPATPVSAARLSAGYDDCRRIEVTGHVRRVQRGDDETTLLLGVDGQSFLVRLPPGVADGPRIDSRVRVRGVCGTLFNWRGVFDHVELLVPAPADLRVEEEGAAPFSLPLLPARDLLRSQTNGRWDRLVRTRGVVLHRRDGRTLYVRGRDGTVIAETNSVEPLVAGDEVDVVGFPAAGAAGPRLQDAALRRLARGRPPLPIVVSGLDAFGHALDAELARFDATLLETVRHDTGTSLVLQAADRVIEARGDGDLAAPPEGSVVEVTGIVLADDYGDASGPQLRVVLRSPADVRVLAQPPWLTPRRAGWIVEGLAVAALVALAWVATLRRRVRARTAELAATEQRYRLLADNATDVIVTTDRELRLTYVSPSVTRDSGYTTDEALEMPLERVVTPRSWALLRTALTRTGDSRAPAELDIEILRKDGTTRWMHVRTSALRSDGGAVSGFLASARDVTARRQAQQELARLAAAIEQSGDSIVLSDLDGAIVYVNPAFERVTGYAAAEVLGRTAALLKSGAHDRAFYEALWATLRGGRTWEGRFTNRRKDGRLFIEDASIAPVRDAEGQPVGYVAVKRDVTRQVQLEDRLAQAEKLEAIGRLAAGIAHDFNNTLAIILNLADLALKGRAPDERTTTCIEGMREAALRAGGLTRQILTFSRQAPLAAESVDPSHVVGEAARMLRLLVPPGVTVCERLHSTALVAADATQLQQVVLNLGTNAGLAMPAQGGSIEIALEDVTIDAAFADAHRPLRAGACVRLAVRDDGYGMRAETLARIFEPFFTTRSSRGGTGMGLAVVHGIVHSHGGAITVETQLGQGSTFNVYLPALPRSADADALPGAAREAAPPPG